MTRTQDEATHAYNYDVKLGNDITVGEKGADGKDGKISVNGKMVRLSSSTARMERLA